MISEGMTKFLAARSAERGAQGDTDLPEGSPCRYSPIRYGDGIPLPGPTTRAGGFGFLK